MHGARQHYSAGPPRLKKNHRVDAMQPLTADRLRDTMTYSPEDGHFRWAGECGPGRPGAGCVAGWIDTKGYRRIKVDGRKYAAHRLVWLYCYGRWPSNQIDHINGIRDDNRLSNLRDATQFENMQNQRRAQSHNLSSGLLGVSWNKDRGKWQSNIWANGKKHYLGRFKTAEEAHARYLAAKAQLHPFAVIVARG